MQDERKSKNCHYRLMFALHTDTYLEEAIFSRILDWISSTEMSTHHEVIAQTKVSGTNEWFFGVKEFLQWSKLENGILWVHAPRR